MMKTPFTHKIIPAMLLLLCLNPALLRDDD